MRLLSALVRIPVRITFELARRAASAAGVTGHADERGTPVRVPPQPDHFRPPEPRRSGGNGGAPPEAPEPVHVSEEPVLVAEVAEEGAEDGAGAEVRVDEPWPGYNRMTAADIRERLSNEPTEVAAAVSLYEAAGKGRSSVLEAAGRRMRLSGRPSG
jgi:hypothetical protein